MAGIERPSRSRCVLARENRGSFLAIYIAKVRITVHADGSTTIREGHGTGEGRGTSPGEVHDIALKAAETDATKRALATFGKPFGWRSMEPGKIHPCKNFHDGPKHIDSGRQHNFARDDTTPIPRPSRYYGRRQDPIARDLPSRQQTLGNASDARSSSDEVSLVPSTPDPSSGKIDKSVWPLLNPREFVIRRT